MNSVYLLLLLPTLLLPLLLAFARVLPLRFPFRTSERGTILFSLLSSLALMGLVTFGSRGEHGVDYADAPLARPSYKVTDLGFLPGGSLSVAVGINDRGEIIGVASTADGNYHPFLYANGRMRDLGVPADATDGFATQINADGTVIGNYAYGDSCNSPHRAFRYRNGKAEELPIPAETKSYYAQGINDAGQIAGFGIFTDNKAHSLLWEKHGVVVPIPGLGDEDNGAFDINDADQVVGIAGNQGYLVDKSGVQYLGDLGGGFSVALSINNRSQVVGSSAIPNGLFHAFLYQSGEMHDLGTLRGRTDNEISLANAVSPTGDVLGVDVERVEKDEYVTRAFLWRQGRIIDLNTCCPKIKGGQILYASGENSSGQIVATGKKDGKYHALLLTPQ